MCKAYCRLLGSSLPRILNSIDILNAERKDIEKFVAEINNSSYKAWTNHGYRLAVKKLFRYLRNRNTPKETPYPHEVSRTKVNVSEAELEKESRIDADKLLTNEEITLMLKATKNPRDDNKLYTFFQARKLTLFYFQQVASNNKCSC